MPRKAKEKTVESEIIDVKSTKKKTSSKKKEVIDVVAAGAKEKKTTSTKKAATAKKETSSKKAATAKKEATSSKKASTDKKETSSKKAVTAKKETSSSKKASTDKKETSSSKKATTAKKVTSSSKKAATAKKVTSSSKKATDAKKETSSKKAATAKKETSSKKSTTTKKATSSTRKKATKKEEQIQIVEYYDLPYTYGNTVVKLLAQTPKTLFVYWEVSNLDIKNFKDKFGEDFFYITKPILIVHNITLNKTTEVEINDFANCWYLNTEDSDCQFDIELARKFINNNNILNNEENYVSIAKSNDLHTPNDHILFEKLDHFITFKNTSTNTTIKKHITSFNFLNDLFKFYKDMYNNEEFLNNPSSNFNFQI